MPEYLAPGVYIEEVSFRSKSIEGVGTTTTGFIGPTRFGPVNLEPDVITSLAEFERVYGDRQQFLFGDSNGKKMHNYVWHAARAFFEEGGKRLYISRTFNAIQPDPDLPNFDDGRADAYLTPTGVSQTEPTSGNYLRISARFPGTAGRMRVWLTLRVGQSILGKDENDDPTVGGLFEGDIVLIGNAAAVTSPPASPPTPTDYDFFQARIERDSQTGQPLWRFDNISSASPREVINLENLSVDELDEIRIINLAVTTLAIEDPDAVQNTWDGLALEPTHKSFGTPDSVFAKFAEEPASVSDARRLPIVIENEGLTTGSDVLSFLFTASSGLRNELLDNASTDAERSIEMLLDGGNDGNRPTAREYEGTAEDDEPYKTGLKAFEDIEDISIVAAPGSTFGYSNGYSKQAPTIINLLISHAERMRYRIAVIDSGDGQTIADVRAMKAKIDSKYAAFYYPWVRVLDPVTQQEIVLPPSGFVTGIYARNDVERAVYKAPANEVVRLAIGFEKTLNKAQQEVLNPEGINCFRFFEGRGFRLWGARTTSSDPEWKYVNLRRYFAYIERSIDRGTQWAVFEPNGDALWANVRQTIQDFLYNEWVSGALLGEKPEKAYFVKCDRSTMTQNDLDNGRLICLVGMAVVKPAEFVIFRIGQWTADRKV
ncbi:MAG TPA: phage tail sheath subtilisin-like domain-containing protein [Pyrinomonadaceae bacterium]|jgi:phage tail sheath protein FI|nr:phage tail sheath subtilisin-like domain-containing protein [Pyrinomonadaceae bacterium]